MHGALNLLLLRIYEHGKISTSQLLFDEGEQSKVTWIQVVTEVGMGQKLDVLLLYEGHSDLGLVGFAQLLDPFFFFFQAQLMTSHF